MNDMQKQHNGMDGKVAAGMIGATLGATVGAAAGATAVFLTDKKRRDQAVAIAKDLKQKTVEGVHKLKDKADEEMS